MTVDTLIMFAGVLVAIAPFIGLPGSPSGFLAWVFFFLGVIVVSLGITVRRGINPSKRMQKKAQESIITPPPPPARPQPKATLPLPVVGSSTPQITEKPTEPENVEK